MADRKPNPRETRKPQAARAAAPAWTLTTGWAALILTLLVVLFFHEVTLGGRTFVSPDASAPAGFVRMGEVSLWKDHVYPLWNPFVFLGMPSFGSGAYNPLIYPPDWPLALVTKVVPLPDMTWMLIYYVLGGLFAFLLAREWGARPEGALLGAFVFVFAPNLVAVGAHGHGSQLVDSAYLPLLVWLAARWLRRGGLHHLGWLAIAGGFQFLRGHVQICFYTWIAIGLLAAVEWLAALRRPGDLPRVTLRAASLGIAAALAFGFAGVYNLPLSDYARHSIRGGSDAKGGVGMAYATSWSFAPYELPSIVFPWWTGFGGATYWGGMPFTDYPNAYVGMVAAVLALFAFLRGGSARVYALVLAVVAMLVSFGHEFPLYGFLYDHLPFFKKFRIPVMIVILFQLAVALAVAWGWSAVLEREGKDGAGRRAGRLEVALGAVLGLCVLAALFGGDAFRQAYVDFAARHRPQAAAAAAAVYPQFMADLGRASLFGLAALALAALARRGRMPAALASIAVLALLAIELWPVSDKVMAPVIGPVSERSLEAGRDDVIDFLEKAGPAGSIRILPIDEFQGNRYAGFGIASVGGYHAAKTRLVQDYLDAGLQTSPTWLRLLGVRYLVSANELPAVPWLRPAFTGSARVYENLLALPRATVVDRYVVVTPAKAILDSVRDGRRDAATTTYLEQDPKLALGPSAGATAAITAYRLNDVTVTVDTPAPALLRLADLWYPDWTATVDGRPTPVLKADYLLRAVAVPAGRHTVVFRFESRALRTGLTLSIASLLASLLLLGAGYLLAARKAPPAGEAA